jgi:acetyl-CoA C-acetyltransferase
MPEAWIIDAVRTPRSAGKRGKGKLTGIHPHRLLGATLSALQRRNWFDSKEVDDILARSAAAKVMTSLGWPL